ncbi:MAG TPA: hypothetical protein VLA37_11560 [Sphingomonadaceae bacterium]|nr:hypothetical protein [Sphingomonadaceae bacterium]
MAKAFDIVMRVVSSLLGLLMICFGGIWILQGLNIAFLDSFMAGDPQWAVYGAILLLFGVGQVVWTNTRKN